jgi:hypothetical protein
MGYGKKKNSAAFSLQVNYTAWVTATCRRNLVPISVDRMVSHGQCGGSPRDVISVFETTAATLLSSSSSFILMRLSGPHSRPTAMQKIW